MIFQHIINVFAEFYFDALDRMIKDKQKNDIIKRLKEDRFKLVNNKNELVKDTKIEKFVGDFELHYPIIFLKMRGHDIEEVYKGIFLAQKVQLSITLMINFCKEMMLIPLDLVQTLKNIQEYDSQRTKLTKSKKKDKGNKTAEERLDGQARALTERDEKIKRQKQIITKQQGEIIALKEQIKKLESKSSLEEDASEETLQAPSTIAPKASFYVEELIEKEELILDYDTVFSYRQ